MSESSFIPAASLRSNLSLMSDGLLMSHVHAHQRPLAVLMPSCCFLQDSPQIAARAHAHSQLEKCWDELLPTLGPRCHPVVPLGPFHVHSGRFEPDTERLHASLSWGDVLSDRDKRSSLGLLEVPAALAGLLFLSLMCQIPQRRCPLSPVRQSQLQRACLTSSDGSLKV